MQFSKMRKWAEQSFTFPKTYRRELIAIILVEIPADVRVNK